MAEEDEIDVLGEFSLDNFLAKSEAAVYDHTCLASRSPELLHSDYTSNWILENPTANPDGWYNTDTSDFSPDLSQEQGQSNLEFPENANQNQIVESTITDESGWTAKEKTLLEQGIEIFGKSNIRLAQFIGTKSAAEVKHYLKYFYTDVQISCRTIPDVFDDVGETVVISSITDQTASFNEVINDSEIPASIEEVIAAVSTAKPTVELNLERTKKNPANKSGKRTIDFNKIPSGHSLLKSNFHQYIKRDHFNAKNHRKDRENETKKVKRKDKGDAKFTIRTKMKISKDENVQHLFESQSSIIPQEIRKMDNEPLKPKLVPILNGEEVIKIKKESANDDSESDIEIDVENDDGNVETTKSEKTKPDEIVLKCESPIENKCTDSDNSSNNKLIAKSNGNVDSQKEDPIELLNVDKVVMEQLMSIDFPTKEVILNENTITELEKVIHNDFFEGRPAKTPSRYLKIRNHIINSWFSLKPSYVTKTFARQGLKNCGDVNCIGRIHHYLEQIGVINFGCTQTNYVRPLYDMVQTSAAPTSKPNKELTVFVPQSRSEALSRSRVKRKFTNDGEGGCTLAHDEKGDVINTTVINEDPIQKRVYIKKPAVRLIYCKPFTEEHPQQYSIHLHLSALLLMDLHAHMSHTEVMGLIGGCWNPHKKMLSIEHYEPCQNVASSTTHCDMCPISQAKAADVIHGKNLAILGWFHSHPTFAPEPSQQDLDTQLSVQQWIGNNKPCIGLILSPFSLHGALIASPYRCLIVDKKDNFEDQYVPFKFNVHLISAKFDVNTLLNNAWRIFNSNRNVAKENRVDFEKAYFFDQSITYMDKLISSIKMHLAKCSDVNVATCDTIIVGLSNICCNKF